MALVKIYIGREAMDAHYVRSLLNGEGIDAEVMGGMLGMAWPLVAPTLNTHPTVWVDDKDVTRALGVLRDHRKPRCPRGVFSWQATRGETHQTSVGGSCRLFPASHRTRRRFRAGLCRFGGQLYPANHVERPTER